MLLLLQGPEHTVSSKRGQQGPRLQTGFHLSKTQNLFGMNPKCGKIIEKKATRKDRPGRSKPRQLKVEVTN